jgi:myosin heavy subunit
MPSDSRLLDIIRDLESKNWNLTFEVEIQKQNVRRLNSVLQKERDEGYEMADDLDQKEAELVKSEEGRAALEEKMHALQSLFEEEKLRAEAAENRAKEWEQKYNEVQQEQMQNQIQNQPKQKKRKIHNDKNDLPTQHTKIVRNFVELHIEAASSDTCAFVPTKKIHEAFQRECTAPIIQQMTLINFSMELAKQIESLLPEARSTRNESCKGYTGILLK